MHDFDLIHPDSHKVSFHSLISTGKVIVSHSVDPLMELPYYQYLSGLRSRIIVVNSKDNPLLHMMAMAHNLDIETYTDPSCNLVRKLKEYWKLTPTNKELIHLLRFQILYIDGQEVGAWYNPVVDQWENFMKDRDSVKKFMNRFGSFGIKWLREQDKNNNLLWTGTNQGAYSVPDPICPTTDFDVFFKHYKLMPNKQLEQKLHS